MTTMMMKMMMVMNDEGDVDDEPGAGVDGDDRVAIQGCHGEDRRYPTG